MNELYKTSEHDIAIDGFRKFSMICMQYSEFFVYTLYICIYFVRSPTEIFLFILELTASDATGFQAFLGQSLGGTTGIKEDSAQGATTAFTEAICAHLGTRALLAPADAKVRVSM